MHKLAGLVTGVFISTQVWATDNRENFAYGITLELEKNRVYEFEVPKHVYQHIQSPQLHDLRIFGPDGNVMPINIILPKEETLDVKQRQENIVLFPVLDITTQNHQDLNLRVERNTQGVIVNIKSTDTAHKAPVSPYYIADLGDNSGDDLKFISVQWNHQQDTIAHALITTSDDLKNWTTAGVGPIFFLKKDNHIFSRNNVAVNGIKRYLKVALDSAADVALHDAKAIYETTHRDKTQLLWSTAAQTSTKDSQFFYEIPAGLPVQAVRLTPAGDNAIQYVKVASGNNREALIDHYQGNIFRLMVNDKVYDHEPITLNQLTHHRLWKTSVLSSNQKQFNAPQLEVAWRPHRIRFLSNTSGEYTVAFGSASVTSRGPVIPSSIEKNISATALLTLPELTQTISGEGALIVKSGPETTKKFVLWVVLALVLLVMGYMTLRLMKYMKDPDHQNKT